MSAGEVERLVSELSGGTGGDEEEEWLYGGPWDVHVHTDLAKDLDENEVERPEEENASANPPSGIEDETPENGVPKPKVTETEDDSDSDSDDDEDDVHVTIGDIKTGATVSTAPPLIPPPGIPITVPPPGFPPPPGAPPPSLIPTIESGHSSGYDSRSARAFPYGNVAFPHLPGSTPSWPSLVDTSKQWDYYSRREKDRDRDRDRDRERDRDRDRERERTRERERERDHSPTPSVFNSDEERYRYSEPAPEQESTEATPAE